MIMDNIEKWYVKNYLFTMWTISFALGTFLFIFNPVYAIFVAIVMVPIFIHDILFIILRELKNEPNK